MMQLIVLKLGGSVITKKRDDMLEVDEKNLNRLAGEIASAMEEKPFKLLVVHGAGPFGHVPAKKYGLCSGIDSDEKLRGFCMTHQSMEDLNFKVVSALLEAGLNSVAYQPSAVGILEGEKLGSFPVDVLERMLSLGLVPVAYGDVLVEKNKGANILSGDHLVPYLASRLKADRIILTTDVDGIFDRDPEEPGSSVIKKITRDDLEGLKVGGSQGTDVTGGMKRKLEELLSAGVESEVISGLKPGLLKKALLGGKGLGTLISP